MTGIQVKKPGKYAVFITHPLPYTELPVLLPQKDAMKVQKTLSEWLTLHQDYVLGEVDRVLAQAGLDVRFLPKRAKVIKLKK